MATAAALFQTLAGAGSDLAKAKDQKAQDELQRQQIMSVLATQAQNRKVQMRQLAIDEMMAKLAAAHPTRLQKATFMTPKGDVVDGSYDPINGQYLDTTGQPVPNARPATANTNAPKRITYKGPNGKPVIGWQIGSKLYDQALQPLPDGTEAYSASASDTETIRHGFTKTTDAQGNEILVPTTTTSTRKHIPSLATPSGASVTPAKGKTATSANQGLKLPPSATAGPSGRIIGHKPILNDLAASDYKNAKKAVNAAQLDYLASLKLMRTMDSAKDKAMAGDQQAQFAITANHILMTAGQKGGRVSQAMYKQAEESAPWLSRIKARWTSDGYLSGVVLTPEQVNSMVDLAHDKVKQVRQTLDDTQAAYGDALNLNGIGGVGKTTKPQQSDPLGIMK